MLQLKNIRKSYTTGTFTQTALDGVSLNFRDNEFVAILGPSGSGKTTMLNIVGGLDHYDSGDLIIDNVSTKEYKDRDWDTYRNNRIGFVFQSYNLIPHQTVLANVELALTLSGVSKAERRERAKVALERVGLGDHINKRPSQMSGGQMQRVAIARALINDPEILLADEPTGALDSKTSVQIMDLLTEIAKDRLVIMVTHNPELAEQYATRIVTLADGQITSDTDQFIPAEEDFRQSAKTVRRTSMSFWTALSLSFNNLMTKKGRTIMTAFAGSIGIIGIAAILSLANGVNSYIESIEEETLSEYPLTLSSSGVDLSSMMLGMSVSGNSDSDDDADSDAAAGNTTSNSSTNSSNNASSSNTTNSNASANSGNNASANSSSDEKTVGVSKMVASMAKSVEDNDLKSFKNYLETGESGMEQYVRAIEYDYGVTPIIYNSDTSTGVHQANPNTIINQVYGNSFSALMSSTSTSMTSSNMFMKLPETENLYKGQYELATGRWPESYDELVLVIRRSGNITDFMAYTLGLENPDELSKAVSQVMSGDSTNLAETASNYTYSQILACEFKLITAADRYQYDESAGVWVDKSDNETYMKELLEKSDTLKIVGIVTPREDASNAMLSNGIYYTPELAEVVATRSNDSEIVKQQLANPDVNVFNGKRFDEENAESNGMDMSSLITIDGNAFGAAMKIDTSALNLDLASLMSGIDLSGVSIDLSSVDFSDFPTISLTDENGEPLDLTKYVDMSFLSTALVSIIEGYQEQTGTSMEDLSASISAYLQSDEVQAAIAEAIANATSVQDTAANMSAATAAVTGILQGYLASISSTGGTPSVEGLQTYLALPEVQAQLATALAGLSTTIDTQAIATVMNTLIANYITGSANNGTGFSAQGFAEYLNSDEVRQQFAQAIAGAIDTEGLEKDVVERFSTYATETLQPYLETKLEAVFTALVNDLISQMSTALQSQMNSLTSSLSSILSIDANVLQSAFQFNMTEEDLAELMTSLMSNNTTSYKSNLNILGYSNLEEPSSISIYPKDFEAKQGVLDTLDGYNDRMKDAGEDDKVISYTDLVGALMGSVTTIVNSLSAVLIAFVGISLVVSSIMIGIITYISVLERKKEIGILRAIGASKRNISTVFNAETIIVGLLAGIIGVTLTALACPIVSAFVLEIYEVPNVMQLPLAAAAILVCISVLLTYIGGLIPARGASRKDPVEALRSE